VSPPDRLAMEVGEEPPPMPRTRCNTWHAGLEDDDACDQSFVVAVRGGVGVKRPAARRNAWGAASYADLIATAIESSPDKRLTLAQIYDWMVKNVQYFSDRADNNSSAGWKVKSWRYKYLSQLPDSSPTNQLCIQSVHRLVNSPTANL